MAEFEPTASPNGSDGPILANTLVVGGGVAGMTAAIETAEVGKAVILVERSPFLGGRVAAMHKYFPKLCPPACGLEINLRRMRVNPHVRVLTLAEVGRIGGSAGDYEVEIKLSPRYVNDKCTCCGECAKVCELERDDDFNLGMSKTKAVYLPHVMAYPHRFVVDPRYATDDRMRKCAEACEYGAIDLDMQVRTVTAKVAAIVWATGWRPYDATKLQKLGFGRFPNVITNVMMERYASNDGPTQGAIVRVSDGKEVKKVGFVQCAGSRDESHLPYCSAVCCLVSMKQATYIRERYPDAEIHMFYIDVRSPGRMEDFYAKVKEDDKFFIHRGKVAKISETADKSLIFESEDTLTGDITRMEMDLAILATGMVPNTADDPPPLDVDVDEFGFVTADGWGGFVGAGVVTRPVDVATAVQDATGAALKAISAGVRR